MSQDPFSAPPAGQFPPGQSDPRSSHKTAIVVVACSFGLLLLLCGGLLVAAWYQVRGELGPLAGTALPERAEKSRELENFYESSGSGRDRRSAEQRLQIDEFVTAFLALSSEDEEAAIDRFLDVTLMRDAICDSPIEPKLGLEARLSLYQPDGFDPDLPGYFDNFVLYDATVSEDGQWAELTLFLYDHADSAERQRWFLHHADDRWRLYDFIDDVYNMRNSELRARLLQAYLRGAGGIVDDVFELYDETLDVEDSTPQEQRTRTSKLASLQARLPSGPLGSVLKTVHTWSLGNVGEWQQVIELVLSTPESERTPSMLLSMAEAHLELAQWQSANDVINQLATSFGADPRTRVMKSRVLTKLKRNDKAAEQMTIAKMEASEIVADYELESVYSYETNVGVIERAIQSANADRRSLLLWLDKADSFDPEFAQQVFAVYQERFQDDPAAMAYIHGKAALQRDDHAEAVTQLASVEVAERRRLPESYWTLWTQAAIRSGRTNEIVAADGAPVGFLMDFVAMCYLIGFDDDSESPDRKRATDALRELLKVHAGGSPSNSSDPLIRWSAAMLARGEGKPELERQHLDALITTIDDSTPLRWQMDPRLIDRTIEDGDVAELARGERGFRVQAAEKIARRVDPAMLQAFVGALRDQVGEQDFYVLHYGMVARWQMGDWSPRDAEQISALIDHPDRPDSDNRPVNQWIHYSVLNDQSDSLAHRLSKREDDLYWLHRLNNDVLWLGNLGQVKKLDRVLAENDREQDAGGVARTRYAGLRSRLQAAVSIWSGDWSAAAGELKRAQAIELSARDEGDTAWPPQVVERLIAMVRDGQIDEAAQYAEVTDQIDDGELGDYYQLKLIHAVLSGDSDLTATILGNENFDSDNSAYWDADFGFAIRMAADDAEVVSSLSPDLSLAEPFASVSMFRSTTEMPDIQLSAQSLLPWTGEPQQVEPITQGSGDREQAWVIGGPLRRFVLCGSTQIPPRSDFCPRVEELIQAAKSYWSLHLIEDREFTLPPAVVAYQALIPLRDGATLAYHDEQTSLWADDDPEAQEVAQRIASATYPAVVGLRLRDEPQDPPANHLALRIGNVTELLGYQEQCWLGGDRYRVRLTDSSTIYPFVRGGSEVIVIRDQLASPGKMLRDSRL